MSDPANTASPAEQSNVVPVQMQPGREQIVWWVVFGVLVFGIVVMLGAWN